MQSTASKLPAYAPPLPHPMKVEQTDVEVTTISSNCLSMVSLGLGDQLGDSSSLGLFSNCPSLSSLNPSMEPGDAKDDILLARAKVG